MWSSSWVLAASSKFVPWAAPHGQMNSTSSVSCTSQFRSVNLVGVCTCLTLSFSLTSSLCRPLNDLGGFQYFRCVLCSSTLLIQTVTRSVYALPAFVVPATSTSRTLQTYSGRSLSERCSATRNDIAFHYHRTKWSAVSLGTTKIPWIESKYILWAGIVLPSLFTPALLCSSRFFFLLCTQNEIWRQKLQPISHVIFGKRQGTVQFQSVAVGACDELLDIPRVLSRTLTFSDVKGMVLFQILSTRNQARPSPTWAWCMLRTASSSQSGSFCAFPVSVAVSRRAHWAGPSFYRILLCHIFV